MYFFKLKAQYIFIFTIHTRLCVFCVVFVIVETRVPHVTHITDLVTAIQSHMSNNVLYSHNTEKRVNSSYFDH